MLGVYILGGFQPDWVVHMSLRLLFKDVCYDNGDINQEHLQNTAIALMRARGLVHSLCGVLTSQYVMLVVEQEYPRGLPACKVTWREPS